MHELDPAFRAETEDDQAAYDVSRWRKAQRERLIAERLAIPAEERFDRGPPGQGGRGSERAYLLVLLAVSGRA